MYKTLYRTLYKIAIDNLSSWIDDFNRRVERYNEAIRSFDKSIPADVESRRLLERQYNQLIGEWQKLFKEIHEAERTFGVKIRDLNAQVERVKLPLFPGRPDKPDYLVNRLLANLGKVDPEVYRPNKPPGRYPDAPPAPPKPLIPPGAKFDQPGPFIQVAPPVAPGHFPERLQATLAAVQMIPKEPKPPANPRQTILGYVRNNWRPVASDIAITTAAGLAGAIAAMLAKKYLEKSKLSLKSTSMDQLSDTSDNQTAVSEPVENLSLHIPPIVPHV